MTSDVTPGTREGEKPVLLPFLFTAITAYDRVSTPQTIIERSPFMIEIKNLNKTFPSRHGGGTVVALDDINLTINDGEIFGIIGLSGAGKSTLVRCMNLLERPTEGEVLIDGEDLMHLRTSSLLRIRRNIGMIFQSYNLLEQRTVLRNVLYPLELCHTPHDRAVERAMELLELVGLADRAKAYPSQLSGGQKQRVAIARALATEPKYILCDEATSALDPTTTTAILELLQKINRTMGVTVVVITHEMAVIEKICHRVAVIDKSHIVEMGTVDAVFSNPQSQIARELILPHTKVAPTIEGGRRVRLVFNGGSSFKPVVSSLVLETGIPVNIMAADTKDIGGRAYGQILIELPADERSAARVMNWLDQNFPSYSTEEV